MSSLEQMVNDFSKNRLEISACAEKLMLKMFAYPSQGSHLITTNKGLFQQVQVTVGASEETACRMDMLQHNAQTQLSEMHRNQTHKNRTINSNKEQSC